MSRALLNRMIHGGHAPSRTPANRGPLNGNTGIGNTGNGNTGNDGDANKEQGYVLVFLTLALVVLMIFAAFTVDVGRFYARANQVQRAADSAALAGVVYLPNLDRARTAAFEAARSNGFENNALDPDAPVVTVERGDTPRRLRVSISDPKVSTVFGKVVMDSISIGRSSTAEYVSNIPLGSPYNALGTGNLDTVNGGVKYVDNTVGAGKQNFWLAVSGYCTAKEDGDLKLSRFDGTHPNIGTGSLDVYTCGTAAAGTNVTDNTDYTTSTGDRDSGVPDGYEYIIDVPCTGRTDPSIPCDPTAAAPGGGVQIEVYNGAYDQGADYTGGIDRLALAIEGTPSETAPTPAPGTFPYKVQSTRVTTMYKLYKPNLTDPNRWDPVVTGGEVTMGTCTTDAATAGVVPAPVLCTASDTGWSAIFPTITTAGRWKVQVYTTRAEANSFGHNAFALRARVGASFGTAICDARVDADTCPGVSGNSSMSIKADSSAVVSEMFLSRMAPAKEFRGKQITMKMWDLGDYMESVEILDPDGNEVSFHYELISPGLLCCSSDGASSGGASGNTNELDVSGTSPPTPWGWSSGRNRNAKYSDRYVMLTLSVPSDYGLEGDGVTETPGFDGWWKIRYTADSAIGQVQDRTTWTVKLVGDPVHLIRE